MTARLPRLETGVLAVALVVLILDASGGAGWGAASAHAVLAARMDHLASAPLYDLVAGAAATLLPFGEVGFRLAVLDAFLAACALAGVVAAVRALLPRDLATAPLAVLLLLIAPPFRDAAAFAGPAMLATCGAVWAVACAASFARDKRDRDAASALAACALVVGSAPWLGAAFALAIGGWLARAGVRNLLAIAAGALGLLAVVWWLGAIGGLPGAHGNLALALAATGRGTAAVIVGAGLLGVGFAALTGLANARWLALLVLLGSTHEIVVGGTAPLVLALLAIGAAIVPSAIVRATHPSLEGMRRHALAFGAGVPLLVIAATLGPTWTVDDPGAAPTELATDLTSRVPHGPGVFVARRPTTWFAVQYESVVAGMRPDLTFVPPLPAEQADAVVVNALRSDRIAAADAPAFGRRDPQRAIPRGRGFQIVGAIPSQPMPVSGPARYASRIGREQAVLLAIERARYEAASQRLDAAARALGREARFGAADLAVLAVTLTTAERPALFGFLPLDDRPGDWMLDLFADDLAWVAGIPVPPVDERAPMPRRLHAKWRDILLGKATPDDAAIAAMGERAVRATQQMFTRQSDPPPAK